ncbi:MAG: hypothetical protein OER82_09060 [Nitrosopumilus sp.]|nr:hypothetical protein [Nitrosopumilus sp.]MDH3853276.1 hypothetical protein [Nitrosopumilus sp.]
MNPEKTQEKKLSGKTEMNKIQQCLCDAPKVFSFNFEREGNKTTVKLCARCRDDPNFANGKDEGFLK